KSVEEESVPLHELQCVLGFALELVERMAQCKKNGTETAGGECGICRVAVLLCHLEGTTRRFDALSWWSCPRNYNREGDIGPCPKVRQSATFEQLAGQLSKSIAFIVVTEARAGDHGRYRVVQRGSFAFAVLQAGIDGHPAARRLQVLFGVQGRRS